MLEELVLKKLAETATKKKAKKARKSYRSLMDKVARDMGLVKVRGVVSGRVYYE